MRYGGGGRVPCVLVYMSYSNFPMFHILFVCAYTRMFCP